MRSTADPSVTHVLYPNGALIIDESDPGSLMRTLQTGCVDCPPCQNASKVACAQVLGKGVRARMRQRGCARDLADQHAMPLAPI